MASGVSRRGPRPRTRVVAWRAALPRSVGICEREAEIEAFAPRVSRTVEADLAVADGETPLPAGTPGGGAPFTAVVAARRA